MSRRDRANRNGSVAAQVAHAPSGRRVGWDLLTVVLAGVILQYVWRIQEIFPLLGYLQFTVAVSAAAAALYLLDGNPARRLRNLNRPMFRWVLVIFALALLSVPTSVHDGVSVQFLTGNLSKTVVMMGILAAAVRNRDDVERLVRVFVAGGAAYVVVAIAFDTGGQRLGGRGSYDPNDLGLFTVSTVPLCIYLMRRGASTVDRLLGVGAAALLLLGSVMSGSRGGFIALVAATLYGVLALRAVRLSKRLTVTAVAAAVLVVAAGGSYWERMSTILKPQEDYNWSGQAETGRMEVWKRGIGYMATHPLLGVGVAAFEIAEGTMSEGAERQRMGIGFKWSAAHNSYVQIGAELGVFGLVAFTALLGLAFREARRIGRVATLPADRLLGQAFGALVVAFAIGAVFLSQAYSTYLYFALALLMAFSRVVARGTAQGPAVATKDQEIKRRARASGPPRLLPPGTPL